MQLIRSVGRFMPIFAVYSLIGGLLYPVLSQPLDQMYRKKLINAANYEKHLYDLVGKSRFSGDCNFYHFGGCSNLEKYCVNHPIRNFVYIAPDGKIQRIEVERSDPSRSTNNKPRRAEYLGILNKTVPTPLLPGQEAIPKYSRNGSINSDYGSTTLFKIEKYSRFDLLVQYTYRPHGSQQYRLTRNITACRI